MPSYLVLIDAPITDDALAKLGPANTPDSTFHVVVPATAVSDAERELVQSEQSPKETGDPDGVIAARWRLRSTMDQLQSAGLTASGSIGVENPLDAVDQALKAGSYDVVVVVSNAAGIAGWAKLDLPSRIERHVSEPVVVLESAQPAT